MSITEQRLKDYQLQMSIYAEQHKMLLASDVLNMVDQLQDDLTDDVGNVVEHLEKLPQYKPNMADAMLQIRKFGNASPLIRLDNAIDIVKCGVI